MLNNTKRGGFSLNPLITKIIFSTAAFLGYGSWAVYSNIMDGSESSMLIAWRAGCIQGVYSALITLVNMLMLEFSYSRFYAEHPPKIGRVYAVITVLMFQYSVIIPVHLINGTPNIFLTLLPGIIIGTAFSYAYVSAYSKATTENPQE